MRRPRFSIAGLMGVVVVVSIGLAGLRYASENWAGAMFLLTSAVLMLAVIGVACRRGPQQTWWLGFALFGWGYLTLAFWSSENLPKLPTVAVLELLKSTLVAPGPRVNAKRIDFIGGIGFGGGRAFGGGTLLDPPYWQVGQCLWTLLAATLGGILARAIFADPAGGSENVGAAPSGSGQERRRPWRRPEAIGLASLVLVPALVLIGSRSMPAPWLWAGAMFLLTWGVLGFAALSAVCTRGRRRVVWLGAALFGAGYMTLIFGRDLDQLTWPPRVTDQLLNALRPLFPSAVTAAPAASGDIAAANSRILKALDQPVPIQFPDETPLEDILKYIQAFTRRPNDTPIPIYVDPLSLQEAEKTLQSPVAMDVEGVPLRTTLRLALAQLKLGYGVRDGLLVITTADRAMPGYEDPFLLVGHCLVALLAAALGSLAALLISDPRRGPMGRIAVG